MIPPLIQRHADEWRQRLGKPIDLLELVAPIQGVAVVVHEVELPSGWTKTQTTVRFLVSHGYPTAPPDCFWTDGDLALQGNRTPQNTGRNPMPGVPGDFLWFSWHVQHWDPNKHRLDSFYQAIVDRLNRLQ